MSDIARLMEVARTSASPRNDTIPYVDGLGVIGGQLTCTMGNWEGQPTSYAYQWKRDAVNVGTNANTYTIVAGDSTHSMGCVVSATNPAGTTAAPLSNVVAVP